MQLNVVRCLKKPQRQNEKGKINMIHVLSRKKKVLVLNSKLVYAKSFYAENLSVLSRDLGQPLKPFKNLDY